MIADTTKPPSRCGSCGADAMGCAVKRGLGGRYCCDSCTDEPSGDSR